MLISNDNAIDGFLRGEISKSPVGHRLPSVRDLQKRFAASPVTIQKVLRSLQSEGLIDARPGDGTYVAATKEAAARERPADHSWQTVVLGRAVAFPGGLDHLATSNDSSILRLDGGFPDASLQAHDLLARLAARAAKRPDAWERCLPEGLASLRSLLAAEMGHGFDADDVMITSGAQSAIALVFRTILRPGDPVVIEDPSYPGAIGAAAMAGLDAVPVPTDEHGVRPDALAAVLRRTKARLVVLQPRHANPSGTTLSEERRAEVLAIVRDASAFVLEDDWVSDLDLDAPTPPPLATLDPDGHVITIRSFSKVTAPGVRIAGLFARGPVGARLRTARLFHDFFTPPLLQQTLADLLASPAWQRHLDEMRTELRRRRDTLVDALGADAPALQANRPGGGLVVWTRLPDGVNEAAFVQACAARGVRVGAGRPFWLTEPSTGFVRLSYASATSESLATVGERLGKALADAVR